MRRRHPPKHGRQRSLEGLRNQICAPSVLLTSESDDPENAVPSKRMKVSCSRSRAPSPASDHASESEDTSDWQAPTVFDSVKFIADNDDSDIESDAEDTTHLDNDLHDSNCCSRLIDFAVSLDDETCDET